MKLLGNPLFLVVFSLALSACSNSPAEKSLTAEPDNPDIEITRTIVMTGVSQVQLKVQKGREDAELFTPKSCILVGSGDAVSAVTVSFAAPCKQYQFKNLIGALYFLDEKAIGTRNAACPVESFNASYGWSLEKA
mgnify:FL=1